MDLKFLKRISLSVYLIILQVIFIILFAVFVEYGPLGLPDPHSNGTHGAEAQQEVQKSYAMFQDVHVMIFIGFGFLMTFLKRYGFGSLAFNMLISAIAIQWGTLTSGWVLHMHHGAIHVDMNTLFGAEFAAAAVLISFGAVLGKLNPSQLVWMTLVEIIVFQVNEFVVFEVFKATDIGDSMVVHVFGAYFGLQVAFIVGRKHEIEAAEHKEASVYHSDLFAMIGTVFLWLFWPSFNSAAAVGEGQYRAVINTYFALSASAIVAFAVSSLVHKGKFNMVHIQNATLAGGVAVGTMADMVIHPWGAITVGSVAGLLSVVGYRYITPFLTNKLRIHDTCGVNNLHGMPGILSGIGGVICASFATSAVYGDNLVNIFPARAGDDGRSASTQALYQLAGLAVSFVMAIVGGTITGLTLRLPFWYQPKGEQIFDDTDYWLLPDDGFPRDEESNKKDDANAMSKV